MFFTSRDRQRLKYVTLERLVAHLRATGWELDKQHSDSRRRIWEMDINEVVVPARPDFGDHVRRIADAVETLARVEDRYPAAVLDELLREENP